MKKKWTIIFLFFIQSICIFAQDNSLGGDTSANTGKKKSALLPDRSFEIGLLCFNLNLANNILSVPDILQEVIIIDLDKLADGFKFNLGLNAAPLYFNYKSKNGWGFGLSADIEAVGILNISGNMLNIKEAVKDNSDISGAVFSSATINTFFTLQKVKVKFNPSLFNALAYVKPPKDMPSSVVYTMDYSNGTVAYIDYDVQIYTGYSLDDNKFSITSKPGMDFCVGLEYPLAKDAGLTDISPYLDFDVGLDLINFPVIPSTMTDYKLIKGKIGKDDCPRGLAAVSREQNFYIKPGNRVLP